MGESWDWWLVAVRERRGGWDEEEEGEEEGEIEEESVGKGYILAFTNGVTDEHVMSVYLSAIPLVNVPRHCTKILV